MIKISLDESVAFDMLAILLIKSQKSNTPTNICNYFSMLEEMKDQIGGQKFFATINSEEFQKLKEENLRVFDLVDLAKSDLILASQVDKANYRRYLAKQELQKRHFDEELTEKKIGYEPPN